MCGGFLWRMGLEKIGFFLVVSHELLMFSKWIQKRFFNVCVCDMYVYMYCGPLSLNVKVISVHCEFSSVDNRIDFLRRSAGVLVYVWCVQLWHVV